MVSLIQGIPVVIKHKVSTSRDAFGMPIIDHETEEVVENVLVTPLTSEEIAQDFAWYGEKTLYELSIPKGDTHEWEHAEVVFFGQSFKTVGRPREYIEDNLPLNWNKKIRVAAYG